MAMEFGKRTSMMFTDLAHQRLKEMTDRYDGLTQPEAINLILERFNIDALEPFAKELLAKKKAENDKRKMIMDKIGGLSNDQLLALLSRGS